MKLDIKVEGLDVVRDRLRGFSDRRIRAAQATALTRTAMEGLKAARTALHRDIHMPTPYTQRQLRYIPATAERLVAAVGFTIAAITDIRGDVMRYQDLGPGETPAGKYLQFQTEGGQRALKRFEVALQSVGAMPAGWYAVPGAAAKMDRYGNQSVGEIKQVMTWFDAAELVAGSRQNMGPKGREKRRKGTKRMAGWEYFLVEAGATRRFTRSGGGFGKRRMHPGIYRRTMAATGSYIEPIMIFVPRTWYEPRFNFYGDVWETMSQALAPNLRRAFQEHADRLSAKARAA